MQFCAVTLFLIVVLLVIAAGCTQSPSSPPVKPTPTGTAVPGNGTWTFVLFGDSIDPANNTTTGISPDLNLIAKSVAAEKPDLALYIGDLVNGWSLTNESPMQNNYTGQLGNWMDAVSPIHNYTTGTGIPLYVIRGNHEDGPPQNVTPLLNAYLATVASGMPTNGPPGEEKLTYSFTYKGAKFIANDEYIAHNGLKETVNQTWVDEQLTNNTRPFTFVIGHSPAYLVDEDLEDLLFSLPVHPAQRDKFWQSIVNNHVSAYLCGHAHLYVRSEFQEVRQIVSGNAGAPMSAFDPANADPVLKIEYPLRNVSLADQKVGYLVVTVNETAGIWSGMQKVRDPKTGIWTTGDTFTLPSRSGV